MARPLQDLNLYNYSRSHKDSMGSVAQQNKRSESSAVVAVIGKLQDDSESRPRSSNVRG
jgi:hypothetical protein